MTTTDGHRITDAALAKKFILAGRAVFTIKSMRTGLHLTYKVKQNKKHQLRPGEAPLYFISVLDHADGHGGYSYLGTVRNDRAVIRLNVTRKSPYHSQTAAAQVTAASWLFQQLSNDQLSDRCELWHEGRCGRCSRPLTHPESIRTGFGPECAGKI